MDPNNQHINQNASNPSTQFVPENSNIQPSQDMPIQTPPKPNKKIKKIIYLVIVFFLIGVGLSLILLLNPSTTKSPTLNPTVMPTSTPYNSVQTGSQIPVQIGDVTVNFSEDWSVKTKEWTDDHSYFKIENESDNQIEIEYFSSKKYQNIDPYLNPLLTSTSHVEQNLGGINMLVDEGKEDFGVSNRNFRRGIWKTPGGNLILIVLGASDVKTDFDKIAYSLVSINENSLSAYSFPNLVKAVNAQEPADIPTLPPNNLPDLDYKEIKIMTGPYEENITAEDMPYRTGYARGYKFFAFKSQRLVAVAFEDRNTNPNSFVESQLFSRDGEELSGVMGTRIEFTAPYTGMYYFVVNSFNNQEGGIRVGVDDREQTDVSTYIKYPNGEEVLKDPTIPESIWVGNSEVALIIEIPNQVEVVDTDTFTYESIPAFGYPKTEPKTITSRMTAHSYNGPDAIPEIYGGNFELAEYLGQPVEIQLTQIGLNRVLVTPTEGLFLAGYQISLHEASEGWIRMFTADIPVTSSN